MKLRSIYYVCNKSKANYATIATNCPLGDQKLRNSITHYKIKLGIGNVLEYYRTIMNYVCLVTIQLET